MSEGQRRHPTALESARNKIYNHFWIRYHGFMVPPNSFAGDSDSHHFSVVWLKNLDRLASLAGSCGIRPRDYHFVDVGCGAGIASLYAGNRYPFLSTGGFDFSPQLIEAAQKNARKFSDSEDWVRFWVGNAKSERFALARTCLFLFNPFGARTARIMLEANHQQLVASESIAFLANDRLLPVFLDFGRLSARDARWNLSVVEFC